MTMKLTEHFTLEELTKSATATAHGLTNTPNADQIYNLRILCEKVLEPARKIIGRPIVITSGFRSDTVNKLVGGVANSWHKYGQACDIRITSKTEANEIAKACLTSVLCDKCIYERKGTSQWLHVQWGYNARQSYISIINP
jgi:zinc D-Ala-D-Ala carboxypeptidase